ncbi:MarR family winged helix-turn-helix transcriptional regulator [Roseicyclus marinus]|uniref:MarR family winged helix-turn-helix transcriptional regulator n=1 Tax=Roseicyclus marinus TaxID=2161673 RepID=UPI00240EA83D|nr:MarR family transcriptional regulator [Roseicyclus marinus]MDG3040530.1 MarR family transcriptional regulator [Roseicyclus marinus]
MSDDIKQQETLDLLTLVSRASAREAAEALRASGLTLAQFSLLDLIEKEGIRFPTALARKLDIESSTMAAILKRAERDGLVLRSPDPKDARGIVVEVTEQGRGLLPEARRALAAVEQKLTKDIDAQDLESARTAMQAMLLNLRK